MLGRAMLWLADKPSVQSLVTQGRLARPVVERFVAGDTLEDAVRAIEELNAKGVGGILDLLGEGVSSSDDAEAAAGEYRESIQRIPQAGLDTTISIKLTQLGLAFEEETCVARVKALATACHEAGTTLEIDMEQSDFVDATLRVYRAVREEHQDVRLAMQSYLRRTHADLEAMRDLRPKVRLVKGAYAEPPELAFQRRREIDDEYRRLTEWLFAHGTDPGIATHDGALLEHAQATAERTGAGKKGFEVQMLYGVRRELQEQLARDGYRIRTYVPFGAAWYPYLMRRMAERPGNLAFVLRAMLGS